MVAFNFAFEQLEKCVFIVYKGFVWNNCLKCPVVPIFVSGNKLSLEGDTLRDSKKLVEKSFQDGAREGHRLLDY